MKRQTVQMPPNHQTIMNRFVTACQTDERVVAAVLYGSYARGAADMHSDLDLALITTDDSYAEFVDAKANFVRALGDPLFLEDFDLPYHLFFIFPNDSEGEIVFGQESRFQHLFRGPYQILLDKNQLLANAVFVGNDPIHAAQIEKLRRLILWFWHELSHFITAIARRQLWWAYGQLEELRRHCLDLAHLYSDFSSGWDGYFKVELDVSAEQLAALQATVAPLEITAIHQAGLVTLQFYQQVAPRMAQTYGIPYPLELERLMVGRLETFSISAAA